MSETFDPYREWLGIADPQRPPGLYVLLGLEPFESDADRIEQAILRRMFVIYDHLSGPHSDWAEKLVDQVQHAESWLTNPARKAEYDAVLRESRKPARNGKPEPRVPAKADDGDAAAVMLVEVSEPAEPSPPPAEAHEEPAPEATPVEAAVPAAPPTPPKPAAPAVPASPDVSAAQIAERILRDDVKPQFVPQRASAVKRAQPTPPKPTLASIASRIAEETPRALERFDTLKPMPKGPPPAPSVKVSNDTLVSQPLLSRTDVIAATKGQIPQYDPAAEKRKLTDMDVSVLMEAVSRFLNRYPKSVSAVSLLMMAALGIWHFSPQAGLLAPRRTPVPVTVDNRDDFRMAGRLIITLSDPKQAVGARSAAAERMAAMPPGVIQKFSTTLESLLDAESDEPTRQALQAALEKIKPSP